MRMIVTAAAILMLGACSNAWDIDGVMESDSKGTKFDKSLKNEYAELAIIERSRGNWDLVEELLNKARTAGDAKAVALTKPAKGVKELESAYAELSDAYSKKGIKTSRPSDAAKAQIGYECMATAYAEDNDEDKADCKKYFRYYLDSALGKKPSSAKGATAVGGKEKSRLDTLISAEDRKAYSENGKSYMLKNGQYLIYYAFGSDKSDQNLDVLFKDIVMEYKIATPNVVAVSGYTDTAGSEKINEALSLRRAKTVSNALVKAGVDEQKIEVKGYGKTNLAVETKDGVAEPKNRRTVVEFKD